VTSYRLSIVTFALKRIVQPQYIRYGQTTTTDDRRTQHCSISETVSTIFANINCYHFHRFLVVFSIAWEFLFNFGIFRNKILGFLNIQSGTATARTHSRQSRQDSTERRLLWLTRDRLQCAPSNIRYRLKPRSHRFTFAGCIRMSRPLQLEQEAQLSLSDRASETYYTGGQVNKLYVVGQYNYDASV